MGAQDRREYFRRRRQKLQTDEQWKTQEAERKAAWYRRTHNPKPKLSETEKQERRRQYDRERRARLAQDPEWLEAERKRRRESYHRNKHSPP
jgi:hypothetical protein